MDISDWPIGKIMQLPDHLFGRRFVVSCTAEAVNGASGWDIAEIAFPEDIVLWGMWYGLTFDEYKADYIRLALGDQLPTTTAMMDGLEPLLPGVGRQGADPRRIITASYNTYLPQHLRMPIRTMGRRLVMEVTAAAAKNAIWGVVLVVSTIPREIPDWFFGRQV